MKTEDQVLNPSPLRSLGENLKGQYLVVEEFKEEPGRRILNYYIT